MFERFRIKTALRTEFVKLRASAGMPAHSRADDLFYEPAFAFAPVMKARRWTAQQAMVAMVTDYCAQAAAAGVLADYAATDPELYRELGVLYRHVVATADADPALKPCIVCAEPGAVAPFGEFTHATGDV